MRAVADALGVSMLDVLVAAGVVDPKDAKREATVPPPPSIDAAIANDPALTDLQRRTLRDILDALRKVETGDAKRVRARTRT
jgi:hypothetical protein